MKALGFLLIALYMPNWAGAATAPRWILLSLITVPWLIFLVQNERLQPKTGSILLSIFMIWAAISGLWTPDKFEFLFIYWHYILVFTLFLVATCYPDTENFMIGLGWGMAVNCIVTLIQFPSFYPFLTRTDIAGLFVNKNMSAEAAALVFVGLIGYRRYALAVPSGVVLALVHARGPLLAVGVAGLLWVWERSRMAAAALALCTGAALVVFLLSGAHGDSAGDRIRTWADTWNAVTFFGHGTGSFYHLFPVYQVSTSPLALRFDHPHNDLLQILFENGWPGLVVFAVFLLFTLRGAGGPERAVLTAFLVEGCFAFPLYLPATQAVFAVAAGCLVGLRTSLRDDFVLVRDRLRRRALGRARHADRPVTP